MKIIIKLIVCLSIAESFISAAPTTSEKDCGDLWSEVIKSRIRNGHKVKGNKYPWMVQLKSYTDRDESEYFQCGGTLIDNQHIITAAHCFEKDDGSFLEAKDVDVYMGTKNFIEEDEDEAYSVEKLWIDPKYDGDSLGNDFAIITLAEKVDFTRHIGPICLPTTAEGADQFTIAGWGKTSSGKNAHSATRLMEAVVTLVPRDECEQLALNWLEKTEPDAVKSPDFNVTELIAETHLCARNIITGSDTCAGDSGGPLMYLGQDDRWFLMGVVSGSWVDCGVDKNGASFYTKLNYYEETIKSQAPSACWRDI
ncbi:tryptase-2-like [Panonychus citri]|uniref:tryptase-2-like n=1 Tax=Panonychus citri TaxID=50023 RepID=UPI002307F90E|nr:tryptase-2-like [Panonychus citri]